MRRVLVFALVLMGTAFAGNQKAAKHVFKGHRYEVFTDKLKWEEAKEACEKLGGHLVRIDSQEENDFIFDLINQTDYFGYSYWIDLTDCRKEGEWVCGNGSKPKYTNWGGGQPDHHNKNENHARIRSTENRYFGGRMVVKAGAWEDWANHPYRYIGEFPNGGDRDRGHGNDDDFVDEDNPGKKYDDHGCFDCDEEEYDDGFEQEMDDLLLSDEELLMRDMMNDLEEELGVDIEGNLGYALKRHPAEAKRGPSGNYYMFVEGFTSWGDAYEKAKAMGGYLATVTTLEEFDFLCSLEMPGFGNEQGAVFVGGHNDGRSISWITGEKTDSDVPIYVMASRYDCVSIREMSTGVELAGQYEHGMNGSGRKLVKGFFVEWEK